jgi:hypothetical protein
VNAHQWAKEYFKPDSEYSLQDLEEQNDRPGSQDFHVENVTELLSHG